MTASTPYKFGKLAPSNAPAISLESIMPSMASASTNATHTPVSTVDYLSSFFDWKMLGNDEYGNCVAVTWANMRRLVTTTLSKETYPDLAQVLELYKTQNPDLDPNQGMSIRDTLTHLVTNGGPDGVKAIAYARVLPPNPDNISRAIEVFGSVFLGMYVREGVPFAKNEPWTDEKGFDVDSGHAVLAAGCTPNLKFITWARAAELAPSYWNSWDGEAAIDEAWVVIWPEHFGSRSFALGVDVGRLAEEYKKLTTVDIILPPAHFGDLYFIKTHNLPGDHIEVHTCNADSAYSVRSFDGFSWFQRSDEKRGVWIVSDHDLYFIKKISVESQKIELHRVPASSNYLTPDVHTPTAFDAVEAGKGIWSISGGDLFFIQTKHTGSGKVEIMQVARSNWVAIHGRFVSDYDIQDQYHGTFIISGGDLYFIKKDTGSGKIIVSRATASSKYKEIESYASWFDADDYENGTWTIHKRDLYFIKTKNTENTLQRVEVHIGLESKKYAEVLHYVANFEGSDSDNGTWVIA